MRLFAIPHSTNVERVALALGHKGLDAELVMCDPRDRAPIRALSGQDLVPVLEDEGSVVIDSSTIIEHLEQRSPDPPLFPADPAARGQVRLFVSWFDRVWKHPPNAIADAILQPRVDLDEIERLGDEMHRLTDLIEQLLTGRDYLAGDDFSAADCAAFPFLKYARATAPDDDDLFHRVLAERLSPPSARPAIAAWIERVDARPRRPALHG